MSSRTHTFSEGVIVDGESFYFDLKDYYHVPTEPDEFYLPFRQSCGRKLLAVALLPVSLATARKAIIKQIRQLNKIGTQWDRRNEASSKREKQSTDEPLVLGCDCITGCSTGMGEFCPNLQRR